MAEPNAYLTIGFEGPEVRPGRMRLDDFIQATREFSACAKRVAMVLHQRSTERRCGQQAWHRNHATNPFRLWPKSWDLIFLRRTRCRIGVVRNWSYGAAGRPCCCCTAIRRRISPGASSRPIFLGHIQSSSRIYRATAPAARKPCSRAGRKGVLVKPSSR